jgi:hypothetical protein
MSSSRLQITPQITSDEAVLNDLMKDINFKSDIGDSTSSMSMKEILESMSKTKSNHKNYLKTIAEEKTSLSRITSSSLRKSLQQPNDDDIDYNFDVTDLPKENNKVRNIFKKESNHRKSRTISQFRNSPLSWDGSFMLDKDLRKEVYRTPVSDSSGTRILNLGREITKGGHPWKPPEVDRILPVPGIEGCCGHYRDILLKEMDKKVKKVDNEYSKFKPRTDAERNQKARLGADLFNLRQNTEACINQNSFVLEEEIKSKTRPNTAGTISK